MTKKTEITKEDIISKAIPIFIRRKAFEILLVVIHFTLAYFIAISWFDEGFWWDYIFAVAFVLPAIYIILFLIGVAIWKIIEYNWEKSMRQAKEILLKEK